jgi:hypothetical protein
MSIRMTIASLCLMLPLTSLGCRIQTCEHGATCHDDDDELEPEEETPHHSCVNYCVRVSVCGGSQADDFDACVKSCERRFEVLPEPTRALCECAETSRCSDVVEGRCSQPTGTGGSSSAGGSPSTGGSSSSGGSGTASGGTISMQGGNASATGGAPSTGGSPMGTGGASGGSEGGTAGEGAGGAPCSAACDCNANQSCVSGHCTPN